MKSRLTLLFAGLLVILLFAAMSLFNHDKPRILILHSYTETGQWEQAVNEGINRELAQNRTPISIRWQYMAFTDQTDKIDWSDAAKQAEHVINTYRPNILVPIGEEAQKYVGRNYVNHAGMRIIYATSEHPSHFGYPDAANATGIREVLPLAEINDVLRYLRRQSVRIRVLGMDDETGRAEREQVKDFIWAPNRLVDVQLVPNFDAWKAAVHAANQDADVLIALSFNGLPLSATDAHPVDNKLLSTWTEHESKPLVIGVRVPFVEGGGALAVVPSAEGIGAQIGKRIITLLALKPGSALPRGSDSQDFLIALRPERLAQRKLSLPAIYTQAARASHTLFE
ncbi:hypothetical protein LSG25_10850 [Paralcaligenes sp. KSB-10]|uniref:hypothetical protein n=1 Tax=Paralcaligenes sp. KSB-10 TaxID=2901142 RepID=UPI001E348234|nr:hypothetical protein [Paralcaligenes sp. KSB-10]UHL62595.1 hypothetical protein LSG25_10850 [Paralcaligenes sp. KSB-10]